MSEIKDVFISYSTKDQHAKNYLKELFDKEGITYFLDEISLELGEDIEHNLEQSLKNTLFTVLLVSKNSLFSTWVCLECVHRLEQESFEKKVTFLPILIDLSVMDIRFPIEMTEHFKAKREELEKLRQEAFKIGLPTKVYNDESERIDKIIPEIGDIIQKIKNGLSANFTDENRKEKDLEKLMNTIKERKNQLAEKTNSAKENNKSVSYQFPKNNQLIVVGIALIIILIITFLQMGDNQSNSPETQSDSLQVDSLNQNTEKQDSLPENQPNQTSQENEPINSDSTKTESDSTNTP